MLNVQIKVKDKFPIFFKQQNKFRKFKKNVQDN